VKEFLFLQYEIEQINLEFTRAIEIPNVAPRLASNVVCGHFVVLQIAASFPPNQFPSIPLARM